MTALQIWNTLGRRSKLALSARDPRELRDVFGEPRNVDRVISDEVLARADRYVAKVLR